MGRPDLGADHADRRGARYSEQLERFYYGGSRVIYALAESGMIPRSCFDASSVPNAACRHAEYRRPVLFRSFVWSGNFSLARECGQFRYCHCLPLCCRLFHSASRESMNNRDRFGFLRDTTWYCDAGADARIVDALSAR